VIIDRLSRSRITARKRVTTHAWNQWCHGDKGRDIYSPARSFGWRTIAPLASEFVSLLISNASSEPTWRVPGTTRRPPPARPPPPVRMRPTLQPVIRWSWLASRPNPNLRTQLASNQSGNDWPADWLHRTKDNRPGRLLYFNGTNPTDWIHVLPSMQSLYSLAVDRSNKFTAFL